MVDEGNIRTEIEHIKSDIIDIKNNAKDLNKDVLEMRDSKIRTEIYLKQIQDSQNIMTKENKDRVDKLSEEAKANQVATTKTLQEIKDEPRNNWKQMSMAWKIGIGMAVISYIGGTIFGLIKAFFM